MTPSIRYWQPLERAFDRMRALLFEPFNLVTWMVLGFSAWLAHLGSSGGGANVNGSPSDLGDSLGKGLSSVFNHVFLAGLVLSVGAIVLVIIALVLWISSRAKFIYLDNVVEGRAEITEPWRRFRRLGDSLFLWRAAFVGCVIAVLIAGALIPALPVALFSGGSFENLSIFAMTSWGIVFGLVVLVIGVGSLYVSLFLDAFVVPIMYRYELKATEAWRYLTPWITTYPWQFVLYGLFVLLLATGFVMVSLLACLLTCCIAGLPYIGTVILLPLWVTYRYLSLEWLAQFDPGFDVFAPLPVEDEEITADPIAE